MTDHTDDTPPVTGEGEQKPAGEVIHFNPWRDFNDAPLQEDPFGVEPDAAQLGVFLDVVFGYCEGLIPVRGFVDKGQGRDGKPNNIWIYADGSAFDKLKTFANWAWREGAALYVIPGTVECQGQARAHEVLQMQAVVVDLDAGDIIAKLGHLVHHLGTPTLVVESGGRTPEGALKLHVWWKFTEAASGEDLRGEETPVPGLCGARSLPIQREDERTAAGKTARESPLTSPISPWPGLTRPSNFASSAAGWTGQARPWRSCLWRLRWRNAERGEAAIVRRRSHAMRQGLDMAHRQGRTIEKEKGAAGRAVIAPHLDGTILADKGRAAEHRLQGRGRKVEVAGRFAARRGAGNGCGGAGLARRLIGTAGGQQSNKKTGEAADHVGLLHQSFWSHKCFFSPLPRLARRAAGEALAAPALSRISETEFRGGLHVAAV